MGIAVIGMAGRFPGAKDIKTFWENLKSGADVLTAFSDEELQEYIPAELFKKEGFVKSGYVLNNVDEFDAAFFGYTPREAETIDPQQRLFLECAWEAFEDAGYIPGKIRSAGVFASVAPSSYLPFDTSRFPGEPGRFFEILLGNDKDYAAARVAYKLNLKGPAFSVQSACSSSLVSVCAACHALLDFQCEMALAGGASVALPERTGYLTSEEGGLSRDGRCHAFDHRASGMNSGNGAAVVLLKRLEDAVADGDHIYGVIRGFAVNNDGADKVGFVAPSVSGQKAVIAEALQLSGFNPESVSYIEAHGTGTPLGDPIEIRALSEVYGKSGPPCAIASVKTNIGHLNCAAGVAGLIRVMLSLEHRTLTPLCNFEAPNPEIDFAATRFVPCTELTPWLASPLRAGVSSFGLGGTNAHLLVEEAPNIRKKASPRAWNIIPLSANSPEALAMQSNRLHEFLCEHEGVELGDVAYTLQHGRKAFLYRLAVVCRDVQELKVSLEEKKWVAQAPAHAPAAQADKNIFFLFPGAGSMYPGMGQELYREEACFRAVVDECATLLRPALGVDIRTVLYSDESDCEAKALLQKPPFALAALFVTEYALSRLLMSLGVKPSGCAGHSFGQYAAAVLCGIFSLEDALRVVVKRGQLMEQCAPGGMLMLFAPEKLVRPLLTGTLSIAAVNTGLLCTVAGSTEDIEALEPKLADAKIRFKRLPVSRAGHSALMDPILEEFRAFMKTIPMREPSLPMLSNVSGTWLSHEEAQSADYWTAHIRQPVRFSDNLAEMLKDPNAVLLEAGPGKGLTAFARRHGAFLDSHAAIPSMRGADEPDNGDVCFLLQALGRLFVAGIHLDWFCDEYAQAHPGRISLPTYPFERERYWSDNAPGGRASKEHGGKELMRRLMDKREDSETWYFLPVWERGLLLTELSLGELEKLDQDWLVFADNLGFGDAAADRLEAAGKRVVRVRPGAGFVQSGLAFEINPSEEAEYVSLFKALLDQGMKPGRIIHAWSVTSDASLESGPAFYEACLPTGYHSLIAIARALFAAGMEKLPVSLGVVSNHLHSVTGDEILSPEKVMVLGPCKVIPSEFLHVQTMNIDIETPVPGAPRHEVVDAVIRDVAAISHAVEEKQDAKAFRGIAAYRGRHRWEQFFDNICLPPSVPERIPLKENGVYLITGGFGGVAFELSKYLAAKYHARLVLTGRTALPPREEWDAWLHLHGEDDAVSRRILQVRVLEGMGAHALPMQADVADRNSMLRVWNEAARVFGGINGVFHAASTAASSMIQAQTAERSFSVIAPKVHGTFVLDELGRDSLDFLMLFSSISSHVGALGHTDYTAACLFMDAFAQKKNRESTKTRVVAVNWGYWDGVGIGVQLLPKLIELMGDVPVRGILPAEGMKCIERALAAPVEQLIVSTSDYGALMETFLNNIKKTLIDYKSFNVKTVAAKRPRLATPYVAPADDVERVVAEVWQELFGIENIGVHDTFIELGGDSLHALPMVSRLEEIFRIKIPIRGLLEENTVAKLAAFLARHERREGQTRKIAQMYMKVRNMSPEEVQRMLAEKKRG